MTSTTSRDLTALRTAMAGAVIDPGHADFDEARKVWNADIDRRPTAIARCTSAQDVAAAVRFATAAGLEIAVRGGAHSMSGQSTVDDGLVIDLSGMRSVVVDPEARRVRAEGGAQLADVDAATQAHGLAIPAGIIGHTGLAGLTLGGGMGWLTRSFGLTIDNMISAEVVLADGRVVRASANEHPDLFWALRGGGGNFGVVTEFEFRCHPVGPIIQFGMFFWGVDQGVEALRFARDLAARLPRELTPKIGALNAPPAPFVPEEHQLRPGFVLMIAGFGGPEQHAAVVEEVRRDCPPLFDFVTPMPYTGLQQMFDEANCWGQHYYEKSAYIGEITDDVIDVLVEHLPRKTSPLSLLLFYRLDQAYTEVAEDETAFSGGRTPRYGAFTIAAAPVAEMLPAEREWARGLVDALRPFTLGNTTYINGMSEYEEGRVVASYGAAYERLAQIKGAYDPGNVFHRNMNIKPA